MTDGRAMQAGASEYLVKPFALDELGRQFERSLISRALARTGGRRIEAATLLGMGRNTITRKIQELGLDE